jgi:predicted nucleic acid-binding Zn ribbon protein
MTPGLRRQVLHEWHPFPSDPDLLGASTSADSTDRLVPEVMKKLGLEQRLQQSQVFYLWPTLVGTDIARHAQPISLRHHLLVVAVDHPVWLNELSRYHKPMILQRVQQRVGKKTVRDIVFRIG